MHVSGQIDFLLYLLGIDEVLLSVDTLGLSDLESLNQEFIVEDCVLVAVSQLFEDLRLQMVKLIFLLGNFDDQFVTLLLQLRLEIVDHIDEKLVFETLKSD